MLNRVRPEGFAAGWLLVLAAILASVPLALTYDLVPHALTFGLASLCSLAIIVAALWCAEA